MSPAARACSASSNAAWARSKARSICSLSVSGWSGLLSSGGWFGLFGGWLGSSGGSTGSSPVSVRVSASASASVSVRADADLVVVGDQHELQDREARGAGAHGVDRLDVDQAVLDRQGQQVAEDGWRGASTWKRLQRLHRPPRPGCISLAIWPGPDALASVTSSTCIWPKSSDVGVGVDRDERRQVALAARHEDRRQSPSRCVPTSAPLVVREEQAVRRLDGCSRSSGPPAPPSGRCPGRSRRPR